MKLESIQQCLKDGIIRNDDLDPLSLVPPTKRLREKRPVAMIECIQQIPCNSCAIACKLNAIHMENVNDIPKIDYDKCTGCMACAMTCPGLAIFLLRSEGDRGYVTLPYEFLPTPNIGQQVTALNREGRALGDARVIRILPPKRNDGTALVTIEVPEEWLLEARAIRIGE
jgi:Fe-S-cluster-containing hydrogenase component 2